jgi:hypothetical protein
MQLYLQHLVFVTPLLLSAAIVKELEPVWVCCGWRKPPTAHSNLTTFTCRLSGNLEVSASWKPRACSGFDSGFFTFQCCDIWYGTQRSNIWHRIQLPCIVTHCRFKTPWIRGFVKTFVPSS